MSSFIAGFILKWCLLCFIIFKTHWIEFKVKSILPSISSGRSSLSCKEILLVISIKTQCQLLEKAYELHVSFPLKAILNP